MVQNFLIRLAAFLQEKAPGDNQSLKLRWMKSVQLSFAVHATEPSMLPN
jgi:hypothetical protein